MIRIFARSGSPTHVQAIALPFIAEPLAPGRGVAQIAAMASFNPKPDSSSPGNFLTGQLLIAMPAMADPRFQQSVIYICAHTAEGAMGLVLNRPIVKPTFDDLLKQLQVAPMPPVRQIKLCAGGPVENARGFVLHTSDWTGEGSLKVDDQMALTASLDVLKVIAEGGGPRECVLALGYAGWGPGQLDQEFQQNAWLSVPADEPLLFDSDHDTKWRRALAKLHIDPLLLSDTAGHA
jgi:putative transcriptional regulator